MDWQYSYLASNSANSLHWHPYSSVPIRGGYYAQPNISYPSNYIQYPSYSQFPSYAQHYPLQRRYPTTYTQSSLTPPKRTQSPRQRRRRSTSSDTPPFSSVSSLERSWTNITDDSPENAPVFTLLCYNVLSQFLLNEHHYLYSHISPLYSTWEYRKYYLLQQLIDSTADILCLQEVDEAAYHSFFSSNLRERGFEGFFKRRTGEFNDGIAIFYNTSKFEIVTSKLVEYKRDFTMLDRDNVGVILKLRLLGDSSSSPDNFLYVASTHLLFNPKAGDVKLGQACVLLAELNELTSQDNDTHPLIICGDMNCLPNSCLYYFLRAGYLNYKFLLRCEVSGYKKPPNGLIPYPLLPKEIGIDNACKKVDRGTATGLASVDTSDSYILSHPYSFYSAYPHSLTDPSLVSTYHGTAFENVDYIFYSCPVLEKRDKGDTFKTSRELKLVSRYSLPPRDDLRKFGPLPNKFHSSDHLQLVAKFCYVT